MVIIIFRTLEDQRILECGEINEALSSLGIKAFRIIISKVIPYEIEGGSSAGEIGSNAKN